MKRRRHAAAATAEVPAPTVSSMAVALAATAAVLGALALSPAPALPATAAATGEAAGPSARAQEADAVAPGTRRRQAPDSVPARGGGSLPPADSAGGPGPEGERLDALTARVASRLRCPVCRSQSVLESSATLSQQMQREIRRRLAAGQSPREVEDYFVSRYGEWILLKPEPEGINLLVYLLPAAALLAGGLVVWGRLRAWTGGGGAGGAGATDAPAGPPDGSSAGDEGRLSPEEEERIDALIREREGAGAASRGDGGA